LDVISLQEKYKTFISFVNGKKKGAGMMPAPFLLQLFI